MSDVLTLQLPREAEALAEAIQEAVSELPGVEDAGTLATRALDPASIGVWSQLMAGAAGVGASLVGIVSGVSALLREKNIKGAKIKVGRLELELGEASASDVKTLLAQLQSGSGAQR